MKLWKKDKTKGQDSGMNRRDFLKTAGLTAAASGTTLTGCRKPVQYILPYGQRPEDLIPGKAVYYATAMHVGRKVTGLLAESHDGRPTKIEGNPVHPMNQGSTDAFAQASVLDLYDRDRSRTSSLNGEEKTLEETLAAIKAQAASLAANGGKGFGLLTEWIPSPSYAAALASLRATYPNAQLFMHDPCVSNFAANGAELVGAPNLTTTLHLDQARVILGLDADFLEEDDNALYNTKGFTAGRQVDEDKSNLNRLYSVEPRYTLTGTSADHRLQISTDQIGEFLAALVKELQSNGLAVPPGADLPISRLDGGKNQERAQKWVKAVAADLAKNRGQAVVIVGDHQPDHVHALGHLANWMLDAYGKVITPTNSFDIAGDGDLTALTAAINSGDIDSLAIVGCNPVYTGSVGVGFAEALAKVKTSIHLGSLRDETGEKCEWHIPRSHYLEAWGDLQGVDGSVALQQPLIAPLYASMSALEFVLKLQGNDTSAYEYVKAKWTSSPTQNDTESASTIAKAEQGLALANQNLAGATAEKTAVEKSLEGAADPAIAANTLAIAAGKLTRAQEAVKTAEQALASANQEAEEARKAATAQRAASWSSWLHRGIVEVSTPQRAVSFNWSKLAGAWSERKDAEEKGYKLVFTLDPTTGDGRFSNNAWLQETPHPITKLTWDNAASFSKAAARELGIKNGDMVQITANGRNLDIVANVGHGLESNTIVLPLGYGRTQGGKYANGAGFDTYTLRATDTEWFTSGATVKTLGTTYLLADVQPEKGDYSDGIRERIDTLVRETTLEKFNEDPNFATKIVGVDATTGKKTGYEVMPKEKLKSLFPESNERGGQQWGMTIDLGSCNGCNACAIACYAENNVPIVGKKEVANGREMTWMRMDRYFDGTEDNPGAAVQPVACAHCENAPCETVCPVAATAHGPEGTNDIAYNRCIGTRYCANNCPYKVRRFNYYNFTKQMDEDFGPLITMQRNPDVTVRFRGVIEKCSYCVQRINEAHIEAKTTGDRDGVVKDGAIQAACSQACAAGAITFGDINDPTTAVSKKKASPRNYANLAELNIHPRTTYLARIRNTNPALGEA